MIRRFESKRFLIPGAAVMLLFALLVIAVHTVSSRAKVVERLREDRREMAVLKSEVLSLRQKIEPVERRKTLSNVQGVLQAVEEVFVPIGLKEKLKTVKITSRRETKEGIEETADVIVEKLTMNEMVNVLYRIERVPVVLTIKKATIKQAFDSPEMLNISLTLSFLKTTAPMASSNRSSPVTRDRA